MSAVSRTRYDDQRTYATGTYRQTFLGLKTRAGREGTWAKSVDVVGNMFGDNPFELTYKQYRVARLSGFYDGGFFGDKECHNWPLLNQKEPVDGRGYFPLLTEERKNMFATEVAAGTNPGVASVSVPSFIGELGDVVTLYDMLGDVCRWSMNFWKRRALGRGRAVFKTVRASYKLADLPYLVWCRGCQLLQAVAAGNITWRFAIAPMLGDLHKLFNFQRAVEVRMRALRSLQVTGAIRRRMLLGLSQPPEIDLGTYCPESATMVIYVRRWVRVTQDLWATARWHLDQNAVLPTSEQDLFDKAISLTYGITRFELLKALWELTPWSWLCDWFVNVSSFLDSVNNSLPVHLDGMCLMRTTTSRTRYDLVSSQKWDEKVLTVNSAYEAQTTKERFPLPWIYSILPSLPSMPALTGGQLSILGSLATLKWGRWNLKLFSRG